MRTLTARVVSLTVVGAVTVFMAVPSDASTKVKPKKPPRHSRTETLAYSAGCSAHVGNGDDSHPSATAISPVCVTGGLPHVSPAPKIEPYVSLTVKDTTGRPVHGEIWTQQGAGNATYIGFCGTLKPTSIPPGSYILTIDSASIDPTCPSVGTSGTITVKYANYR